MRERCLSIAQLTLSPRLLSLWLLWLVSSCLAVVIAVAADSHHFHHIAREESVEVA